MIVPRGPSEPITDEMHVQLVESYPSAERLRVCFVLARDLATCEALWRGEPVDPDLLDPGELVQARAGALVQLVRPVDLVNVDNTLEVV